MLRILLFGVLLLSVAPVLADDVEENFKKAVAATGPEYVKLREELVKSAPEPFLKEKLKNGTVHERIVAIAVLGWKSNEKLYAEKSAAKTYTSRMGNTYFEWATNQQELRGPIAPLGMELLFKNTAGKIGQASGQRAIGAAGRQKPFEHLDILFDYLAQSPVVDVEAAKLAAQTIAGYPPAHILPEKVVATLKKLSEDEKNGPAVCDLLANALLRGAGIMKADEKEELVESLTSEEGLLGILGPETALRIAGTIGGPKVTVALETFLNESSEPEKFGWIFQSLRKTSDGSGTVVLTRYAADNSKPEGGRVAALDSLVAAKYTDEVGTTVKGVLADAKAPARVRYEALRTLDQLTRVLRNEPDLAEPLRAAILASDFDGGGNADYQGPIEAIRNRARNSGAN